MDLTNVNGVFHPTMAQYTFFSAVYATFSKIDHILGHKAGHKKYKKIEIIHCILSDHNTINLELNNKRSSRKHTSIWMMKNMLPNDQLVTENKEGNQKFFEFNENVNTTYQNLWDTAKTVQGGNFTAMSAYIQHRKISSKRDLLHSKSQNEEEQAKPKIIRKREIIKIRAKINEIDTKMKIIKIK
jgi:hypothetical protein